MQARFERKRKERANRVSIAVSGATRILDAVDLLPEITWTPSATTIPWDEAPETVNPASGNLYDARAKRKIQQIENLVNVISSVLSPGDVVAEFGAGSGHLGLALAWLRPDVKVILVDKRDVRSEMAKRRVEEAGLNERVQCLCTDIESFGKSGCSFDVGIGLHNCGLLTDLAIELCVSRKAKFVVTPCCYGQTSGKEGRNAESFPRSNFLRRLLIDEIDGVSSSVLVGSIASIADYVVVDGSWDFDNDKYKTAKMCMNALDADRICWARENGYVSWISSMEPRNCTPKNNIVIGLPRTKVPHNISGLHLK